ncbi:SPOR domain-containing protein [Lacimicrobium alkaliphilum]|uniref:Cell division protein DedD n=1 Tax=Lacimicrobium alkaliphilum TaxID=1526571 RepID=A0ABQ1RG15_9ALTE|nr:SPOR domain-containing protein [Lacimicrobium alkaliphilum]GGD67230.1 cell division protein DedD [Lacimicrobium alkaliphilum]
MTDSKEQTTQRGGSAFQNRLVGTVILVALAVIFLPDIFDGEKVSHQDTFVELPERPDAMEVEEPGSFPRDEVAGRVSRKVEIVDEVALDDPPTAGEQVVAQHQPESQEGDPQQTADPDSARQGDYPVKDELATGQGGWVIQLGSFRHEKNVAELMAKLENGGYRAFNRKVQTSSGTLTKVFVGPDLQKEALQRRLSDLNTLTGLRGKITAFEVD